MEAACDSCAGPGDPAVGVVSYRAPPLSRDDAGRPPSAGVGHDDRMGRVYCRCAGRKDNTEREMGWLMRWVLD